MSFKPSMKNWSSCWSSSRFGWALLFYYATFDRNPEDSYFTKDGFRIDFAWTLSGPSWSFTAAYYFWILWALCLRLLKLCLLLFDLWTVLFVGSWFWLLAFVITKSIYSFATRWLGSLSRNSLTFLYCTSFSTRCSSFSRSFWPIIACDKATNAALACWRTSWLASWRYFASCTSSLSFSLKNKMLLSSCFTMAQRHWQNLSLCALERLLRFYICSICSTLDS